MNGNTYIVQYLLHHGAIVSMPGDALVKTTPLHVAARGKHFDICLLLVKHGADVWYRDEVS
jgi:ankyrin repeat protein